MDVRRGTTPVILHLKNSEMEKFHMVVQHTSQRNEIRPSQSNIVETQVGLAQSRNDVGQFGQGMS